MSISLISQIKVMITTPYQIIHACVYIKCEKIYIKLNILHTITDLGHINQWYKSLSPISCDNKTHSNNLKIEHNTCFNMTHNYKVQMKQPQIT